MADADPAWASQLIDADPATSAQGDAAPAWAAKLDQHAPTPVAPASAPVVHRAAPAPATPYQKAAQPIPASAPEPSWADTAQQAASNLIPSAKGAGQAMLHALIHPVQTVQNVGQLAAGVGSQAAGALGLQQDPQQKSKTEALAKAVEDHYAQTYGSVKGFKQAVSTDPVSVAMDASTLLSGGAGAAGKVAGLEKAASIAGKATAVIDPMTYVKLAAKTAAAPVKAVARGASSMATGVPASLMKVAAKAGSTADPALRGAFLKFYTGQGDPSEFLQTAQNALGQVREDASNAYLAKKSTLLNAQPSFQPVDDAIAQARNETMRGGVNVGQFQAANQAVDQAEQMVNGWKSAPDPSYQSLLGFDNLKQAIWDLRDSTGNAAAQKHLGAIYNGVKSSINDIDPEYANLMEQYQTARNNITDTQKTLVGAGKAPSATTAMAKSLRALKTPAGKNLFGQLSDKEPTLPYMLAGNALHPWGAGGKAGLFEGLAVPAGIATGVLAHNPVAGGAQLLGQVAGQSPKVAGAVNYAAGALSKATDPALTSGYYSGRVGQTADEAGDAAQASETSANPPSQIDQTWNNILQQESGNRQWDAKGKLIVSNKGAIGAAQVMPGTGPVAAKLAGVPWDPQRLATDEAYNRKLGRAYFEGLVQQYGGDLQKAAAAYNAGPTNVDRALNAAQTKGGSWLPHLPKQTQAYVPAVTRPAYASGGKVDGDRVEVLVQKLMAKHKAAKKAEAERTKPLLKTPDDSVARALEVASRAI